MTACIKSAICSQVDLSLFKKFPVQKPGANDFIFCTKHSDTDQFCKKPLYILRSRRNSKTLARQGKIVENKQKHPTISPNAWLFWASWGGRGRKFKSCHSDQIKPKTNRFRLYFLHFRGKIERFLTTFAPPEIPKIF